MADSSSYRSSRAGALPPRPDEPSADPARHAVRDPLAELVRLIEQDEAFAAIVRDSARQEPRVEPPPRRTEEPQPWRARPDHTRSEWDRVDSQSPHDPHGATADAVSRHLRSRHPIDPDPRFSESPEHGARVHDAAAYDAALHDAHGHERAAADGSEEAYASAGHARPDEVARPPYDRYAAGGYDAADDEDDYADVPSGRRRALVFVAAVIGQVAVGSAGAYGYWIWTGGSAGNAKPPLIKADMTPNKIEPATQGDDSPWNTRIYGRFDEKGSKGAERPVPREETPTEVKPAAPRPNLPTASGVYGPAPSQTPGPAPAAAPSSAAPAEPPKQAVARAKQGTAGPAPMVLSAQSPAAEPSAAPAGGYVVQLSSRQSEEQAQASFRALQTKYPNVFGSRPPLIRRADQGDKGVVFRAQVGPFANVEQANEFCSILKSAGGQCSVQKN
jgi:cell division septation protein DedD